MSSLEDDISFFSSMLEDLLSQEQQADQLLVNLKKGFKKCCVAIEKKPSTVDQEALDEKLSEELLAEIEQALLKARLAYDASKPVKKVAKPSVVVEKVPVKPATKASPSTASSRKADTAVNRQVKPAHQTAPFQTFNERPRRPSKRSKSANLRGRAQSWIEGETKREFVAIGEKNTNAVGDQPVESSVPSLHRVHAPVKVPSSKAVDKVRPTPEVRYHLTLEAEEALEELKLYVKCFDEYAAVSAKNHKSTARTDLLQYIEDLSGYRTHLGVAYAFFATYLPELVTSCEEFQKISRLIDWEVATETQLQWHREMVSRFQYLLSLAEQARPLLMLPDGGDDDEDGSGDDEVNSASIDPPGAIPSAEDVWKAYVCSGNCVDDESKGVPRSQILALGPVVFPPNTKQSDLIELAVEWETVFQLQRKLKRLAYVEQRLPDWLGRVRHQEGGKASTFRLLCALACGLPPVTLADDHIA